MRVYEASTLISAEFGGIRDLSRHLSLNCILSLLHIKVVPPATASSLSDTLNVYPLEVN